jgi:hypothetical protein
VVVVVVLVVDTCVGVVDELAGHRGDLEGLDMLVAEKAMETVC